MTREAITREDYLKKCIKDAGYTYKSFAKAIDMPYTTLLSILKSVGGSSIDNVLKICAKLSISADELAEKPAKIQRYHLTKEEKRHIDKYRLLDLYGKRAVDNVLEVEYERVRDTRINLKNGKGRSIAYYLKLTNVTANSYHNMDLVESMLQIPDTEETRDADFAIAVDRENMEPLYHVGEILLVKKQETIDVGEVGVFIVNGESFVNRLGEGGLISENPNYDDYVIQVRDDFECLGKVIGKL